MSVPVSLDRLREALADFGRAPLLLTVSDGDRPHAVAVAIRWEGDRLAAPVGHRTAANARARPLVSLVWPAVIDGGYTLIVDGVAALAEAGDGADAEVLVSPTKAVLHRAPATEPADGPSSTADASGACTADCVPLVQT